MKKTFIFFLLFSFLFGSNLHLLLNKIEKNEDLSNLTKQESGGISYVITRYQLDMMQAHYLRDILINTILGYNENRYNVLDPWSAPFIPYSSIGIRVFIDNQEIGSAKYDNGLYLFGNINLDFVDHIEIYYMTPNYKDGIEPSFVVLKLFTKSPYRDQGNRVLFYHSSEKSNTFTFEKANFNKKNAYFIHFSKTNLNHPEYFIQNKFISRDENNFHFLTTYYFKNSQILINAIHKNQHDFMGMSLDGAPNISKTLINEFHFGYKYHKNFTFKFNFDYTKSNSKFYEEPTPLYIDENNIPIYFVNEKDYGLIETLSLNKYINYKKYDGWIGIDFRNKKINFPFIELNNQTKNYNSIKNQRVISFFTENRYQINKKNIFSFAYKGTKYYNNGYDDYYLNNYKFGHTFVYNRNNIFKLFYYHFEYPIPLYFYSFTLTKNLKYYPQKGNALIFKYKKNFNLNNKIQIIYFTGKTKHYPYIAFDSSIYNSYISLKILDLRYKCIYNEINNLIIEMTRMIFSRKSTLKNENKISILNTHRYNKIELFENYIFRKANYLHSSSVINNLNLGIKYNINDNLTVSLKGENLLNRGYTRSYPIYNYLSNTSSPYTIQLQEKKLVVGLEYTF